MKRFLIIVCAAILLLVAQPEPKRVQADVIFASSRFGFNRGFNRFNSFRRPTVIIQPSFNRFSNRGFSNQLRLQNQVLQQQLFQQQLLNQQQFQFQRFGLNGCGGF